MSFRYKSALLSLASFIVIYGVYFASVVARHRGFDGGTVTGLVVTVIAVAVVQIAGHIVIALTGERGGRADERERGFDLRATRVGYYAMITGVFGVLPFLGATRSSAALANSLLLIVVIAECGRQAVFLVQHHRAA